jgi:hypothetical protein
MAIDFFESELSKVQKQFKSVYGKQEVKDLRYMHKVIFAIIGLGLIKNKITSDNKVAYRKEFMRRKKIILSALDSANKVFLTINTSNQKLKTKEA